ncbi:hypothetical protein HYS82_02230 [Candidatus Amesbacteria bacterium]|nr:hypothetical protein [Candidatus Amesbacteria bacterium]
MPATPRERNQQAWKKSVEHANARLSPSERLAMAWVGKVCEIFEAKRILPYEQTVELARLIVPFYASALDNFDTDKEFERTRTKV